MAHHPIESKKKAFAGTNIATVLPKGLDLLVLISCFKTNPLTCLKIARAPSWYPRSQICLFCWMWISAPFGVLVPLQAKGGNNPPREKILYRPERVHTAGATANGPTGDRASDPTIYKQNKGGGALREKTYLPKKRSPFMKLAFILHPKLLKLSPQTCERLAIPTNCSSLPA